jgi:hypothetical protein
MSVVIEMDSYVSNLGWGVVMVLVQKQNRTSRWLKLHASVPQFFGTKRTHSHVPGLMGDFFETSCGRQSKFSTNSYILIFSITSSHTFNM